MSIELATHARVQSLIWDDERRMIITGGRHISLTPMGYCLLSALRSGQPTRYQDIIRAVYGCDDGPAERMALEKLMKRTRNSLVGTELYIFCVVNLGYVLYPRVEP